MLFASEVEHLFTQEEIEEVIKDAKQFYINYAEVNWLNQYRKIKQISRETKIPDIVLQLSDMPHGSSGFKKSKVENSVLKTVQASEWLNILDQAIVSLNSLEQKLIRLKYLKRRNDGAKYSDEVIYPELFVGRTKYYQIKRDALEKLGRKLYSSVVNERSN